MADSVLLFTDDIESARREIDANGGQITQQFTDSVLVANFPDSVDPQSLEFSTPDQPSTLDPESELSVGAWRGFQDKRTREAAPSETEGLSWDAGDRLPPDRPEDVDPTEAARAPTDLEPQPSTGTPTSLYMTGSVAVGVVIVSGTPSGLGFTAAEQQTVIQEVQEGLDFLANAEPRANLSFIYDIRLITVSSAPGPTTSYEAAEAPWRNAATADMGFSASRQGSIDYVNDLRQRRGTNWAYVAYFTKYPLKHFAYAVSEKTVMHYDNDGWGTDDINKVFAHETCHIFGAADEYGSCTCGGSHGFLGVPNNNCRNCSGTQLSCLMDGNVLELCEWSRGQIGWDESLFPGVFPPLELGNYAIQQKSSSRFMDAHQSSSNDYSVVTRTAQNNNTQRWRLTPVGTLYTIQQVSNSRFLDAFTSSGRDYSAVTRTAQNNDTQRWVLMHSSNHLSTYTIQQLFNGRYLDAWEMSSHDFNVVTRARQNNDTQRWIVTPVGDNVYTLQQRVNGRFLDAHLSSANDFSAVTRTEQNDDTQRWFLTPVGGVYTIQQRSNGRFLDAHETSTNDYSVVTRTAETNDTQRWVIQAIGNDTYTVQQLVNGRFVDAHESSGNDYSVVTRARQNNDTQRWIIKAV
jgi:hypothetical protein